MHRRVDKAFTSRIICAAHLQWYGVNLELSNKYFRLLVRFRIYVYNIADPAGDDTVARCPGKCRQSGRIINDDKVASSTTEGPFRSGAASGSKSDIASASIRCPPAISIALLVCDPNLHFHGSHNSAGICKLLTVHPDTKVLRPKLSHNIGIIWSHFS